MSFFLPILQALYGLPSRTHERLWVLQQTIKDSDRGGFTTPERQQDHISYHDAGLRGAKGAFIVLEALATNPFASRLTLSHNFLADDGAKKLSIRSKFANSRRNTRIRELNLASNSISDSGFSDVIIGWNELTDLYLSNNQITLTSSPSPMLSLGRLGLLSLTSNPIDNRSIALLFRDPRFAPPELKILHLSACRLDSSVAFALATWLEDNSRSASLEWLAVNGNEWGRPGCERIVWALARRNGNKNLLRLEMLSCDSSTTTDERSLEFQRTSGGSGDHIIDLDAQELKELRAKVDSAGWKALLEKCETRNQVLRLATRRAAIGLISTARTVLLGSPGPLSTQRGKFPWRRLPEEIKELIWRWVAILSAYPTLENQPVGLKQPSISDLTSYIYVMGQEGCDDQPGSEPWSTIPEPLTGAQLLEAIRYAQDRDSLQCEILFRVQFNYENRPKGLNLHRPAVEIRRIEDEADRLGKESVLKACGCERFKAY
ncbi:hypothetical protein BY996DRAFT_7259560 [Phakopsora pachyrhizi]|nr:hypothetical protein BY996DRAFT_7259560 [Phakopsora pachyrhizi]